MTNFIILNIFLILFFTSEKLFGLINTKRLENQNKSSKVYSNTKRDDISEILKIKKVYADKVDIIAKVNSDKYTLYLSTDKTFPNIRYDKNSEKVILTKDTIDYQTIKMKNSKEKIIFTDWNKKNENIVIKNLTPKSDYALGLYQNSNDSLKLISKYEFNTLALEPSRQAMQISFGEITDTTIKLNFIFGNGESRILVGAIGDNVDIPVDGTEYKSSNIFGNLETKLGKSFILYNGKDKTPQVTITNLEPGIKYTFAVFEYNGKGKYTNYVNKITNNNQRSISTRLKAPEILNVETISENSIIIKWKKIPNNVNYIIDVATNEKFTNKVEDYNQVDVGDLDNFEISDLIKGKTYYIRIKARGTEGESLFSKPYKFIISK